MKKRWIFELWLTTKEEKLSKAYKMLQAWSIATREEALLYSKIEGFIEAITYEEADKEFRLKVRANYCIILIDKNGDLDMPGENRSVYYTLFERISSTLSYLAKLREEEIRADFEALGEYYEGRMKSMAQAAAKVIP